MNILVIVLPVVFVVMVIALVGFVLWKKKMVENERTGQDPTAIITKSRPESKQS
jgi:flagellar basal body-associated protein FliL